MLTKRQLEDAAECLARFHERTCGQCSCNKFRYGYVGSYGCTENAAQTAIAYRVMLERLEWSLKGKLRKTSPEREYYCPICENNKRIGHEPDCELAALLKESEGEVMREGEERIVLYERDEMLKQIEALQQENEQLQAQVARMREVLRKAREAIKAAWSDGSANAAMAKASEALAAIDKVIGGKEDV